MDLDRAMRRLRLDLCDQARQEQRVEVVAGSDAKCVPCRGGFKATRVGEQRLGGTQDACGWARSCAAGIGGHHPAPDRTRSGIARPESRRRLSDALTAGWYMPSRMAARRHAAFG
jgi:hypothetical protein